MSSKSSDMKWYVIQSFSGFETKVRKYLKKYIKLYSMDSYFGEIMIPSEGIIEMKGGQRRKSERKFFPGYVLVQMIMNEKTWHFIRGIPKVMGFVGGTSDRPASVHQREIEDIVEKLQKIGDQPRPKTLFEPGEVIRVSSGPFADFNGIAEEIDYEKNRLKVSVSIFGRSTPVELDFSQVEKI
ncbi:transcription termination/antitermination protein NusG [Candidatus Riesia pediculicola]|uniref:Transcription termination/antitermination protein NusG n=1 Tax=Riesia pediculicola (strain USDA) TaxID=515618 RepID=D4G8J8_RIEPU|nr:transcription termination/antitermination protein NusG [Candidatus Riesia pediculicola]ADD79809.1 transcription termination/antitermination factor NusG [Candidatus Riesia pediculicola USDA]ARC53877.1 transcription antiterminator NusG [Candidatus Riesia pediculicola]ARC54319.1 transcription antiterminator NusG [Candidatus Riesia pediculicola]QOJ86508.1 transcription termination/antitermination protein NusG [Candidatus Riesia pediculicola]